MRGATKTRSRRREWLEPIALEADAEDLVAVRVHERGGPATRASRSTPRGAFRGRRSTDRRLTAALRRSGRLCADIAPEARSMSARPCRSCVRDRKG
jgi:hypothetical protein